MVSIVSKKESTRGSALLAASRVWAQGASAILFLAASVAVSPSQFGEFAIATSIFLALATFVGHGTYEYVMKERDSDNAAPTSFFLNMGTASVASIAAFAISIVIPHIVASPHIGTMLRLLTPAFFLMGVNSVMESVILKRGEITKVGMASIATETVALGVALAALAAGAGVLALVFQRVTREGMITLVYAVTSRWTPRIAFDVLEAKKAIVFAAAVVTTRFMQTASTALVDVLIGAVLSTADAGLFRFVMRLLTVASDVLYQPFRAAMWVSLSPLQSDHEAFSKTVFKLLEIFGVGLFAAMAGAALIAAPVFHLMFAPEWQRAVPVVYAIALTRLVALPQYASEFVFALKNRTGYMTLSAIAAIVLNVVTAFVTAPFGLYVFSGAQVVVALANQLWIVPVMSRSGHMPVLTLLRLMARLSLDAITMIAVAGPWVYLAPSLGLNGWPLIVSTVIVGAIAYILAAREFTPEGYSVYADGALELAGHLRQLIVRKHDQFEH